VEIRANGKGRDPIHVHVTADGTPKPNHNTQLLRRTIRDTEKVFGR